MRRPKIAIIGAGNLGTSLAQRFVAEGIDVSLGTRRPDKPYNFTQYDPHVCRYEEAVINADHILLTVPDDVIEKTCDRLSGLFERNQLVGHCSGALDNTALTSAKQRGCATASLHPLNTFPSSEAGLKTLLNENHNTALYWEGDSDVENSLIPIFESIGFQPKMISTEFKALYHAACVFACNLLTALVEVGLKTAEAAKLDRQEFWYSLQPLIHSTLDNISEHGTAAALSGPIARGDVSTINRQISLLSTLPGELDSVYRDLSHHAVSLAKQNARLNTETADAILKILSK